MENSCLESTFSKTRRQLKKYVKLGYFEFRMQFFGSMFLFGHGIQRYRVRSSCAESFAMQMEVLNNRN